MGAGLSIHESRELNYSVGGYTHISLIASKSFFESRLCCCFIFVEHVARTLVARDDEQFRANHIQRNQALTLALMMIRLSPVGNS